MQYELEKTVMKLSRRMVIIIITAIAIISTVIGISCLCYCIITSNLEQQPQHSSNIFEERIPADIHYGEKLKNISDRYYIGSGIFPQWYSNSCKPRRLLWSMEDLVARDHKHLFPFQNHL